MVFCQLGWLGSADTALFARLSREGWSWLEAEVHVKEVYQLDRGVRY
jgi:hypothetical protein